MASELSVRSIVPQTERLVTVGVGISVDADSDINIESPISVVGNLNIGHADVSDKLLIDSTLTINNDAVGDGSNITNLETATTRNRVIAYQYVLDPLTFKA